MKSDRVWEALETVMDPEIPTVSVVELGLIRQIGYEGDTLVVTMTPSFVGCPALDVIKDAIHGALEELGAERVVVKATFNPPWSSDWITSSGRHKLAEIGLAPPPIHRGDIESALDQAAICPYCDSTDTTLKNSFGPTLCRAIYFCNNCTQPFEQFKPI